MSEEQQWERTNEVYQALYGRGAKTAYQKGLDDRWSQLQAEATRVLRENNDHDSIPHHHVEPSDLLKEKLDGIADVGRLIEMADALLEEKKAAGKQFIHGQWEYIPIGYNRDGTVKYRVVKVWLTEVTLGREYACGKLFNQMPLPTDTLSKLVILLEREVGAQIFGEVAGYDKKRVWLNAILEKVPHAFLLLNKVFESEVAYNIGAITRVGQIAGLAAYQNERGLFLVSSILNKTAPIVDKIAQLEACYEAAQQNPELAGKIKTTIEIVLPEAEILARYPEVSERTIAVPTTNPLFPSLVTPLAEKLPTWSQDNILVQKYIAKVSATVYERCEQFCA